MGSEQTYADQADLKLLLEKKLRLDEGYDRIKAFRILSRRVSRYPHDLRAHAQRILICNNTELNDCLPGALRDLSIALAGKGEPFFSLLLQTVKDMLAEEQFSRLQEQFNHEQANQCWRKGSVLASGVCNSSKLVHLTGTDTYGFNTVLEEARSYIEYGQTEEAQALLEQELLKNPADAAEVANELINLYQYTRNHAQLENMTRQLEESGIELWPQWTQCLLEAESWK